jgi:TatD DNase family protein
MTGVGFPMIDVHCHLNDKAFDEDRRYVVSRAGCIIVDAGTDMISNEKSLEISRKFNQVYSTFGLDPCLADRSDFAVEAERVREFILKNRRSMVGIGEIGLDFLRIKEHRDLQEKIFSDFIDLAKELKKPVVVHSRWASKQVIDILLKQEADKAILHAFPGNQKDVERATEWGYFISVPTSVCYSSQKQDLVGFTDLNHMVIETDSPVMSPVEGERNEPKNLIKAAEKIAEIKNLDVKEVIRVTTRNARRIYKIKV